MQVRHNRPRVFTTPSSWKRLPGIKLNPDKIATVAQAFTRIVLFHSSLTYPNELNIEEIHSFLILFRDIFFINRYVTVPKFNFCYVIYPRHVT